MLARSGTLTHLVTAFSREQSKKVYVPPQRGRHRATAAEVQDRVAEEAAKIKALFDEGAVIYSCGATAMGQSVPPHQNHHGSGALRSRESALREVKDALSPIVGDAERLRGTRIIEELWG